MSLRVYTCTPQLLVRNLIVKFSATESWIKMQLNGKESPSKPSRALVTPMPFSGHFNPFSQLIRQLARENVNMTVVCTPQRCQELNDSKTNGQFGGADVEFLGLFKDLQENSPSFISDMQEEWTLRSTELDLSRFTCMITELPHYFLQDVADELGIPRYVFIANPSYLALYFILGKEIAEAGWLFENVSKRRERITLPGLSMFTPIQTPRRFGDIPMRTALLLIADDLRKTAGLLVNSFEAFDKEMTDVLFHQLDLSPVPGKVAPKVFPLGPQIRDSGTEGESVESTREITAWLDTQRESSVLLICLGSRRALPENTIRAFAQALEQTKYPFVWVLRLRPGCSKTQSLPEGFEKRTETQGIVSTDWVNQRLLLQHPAVGGFLSHCGWNSVLESICAGVPIAACPMYAEQGMNSRYISEGIDIAVEIEYRNDLLDFDSQSVTSALSTLMEDGKIRSNMRNMQKAALQAMSREGSSYQSFQDFLRDIA